MSFIWNKWTAGVFIELVNIFFVKKRVTKAAFTYFLNHLTTVICMYLYVFALYTKLLDLFNVECIVL